MKSILFGLSLASAAVAQISVMGVSMVPVDSETPAMSMPTPTPTDMAAGYGYGAAPSQQTAAPSSSVDYYSIMPYSSMQAGGYKSMDCGYGWKKQSDGTCGKESWVR